MLKNESEHLASLLQYYSYLDEGHGCWLWKLGRIGNGYGQFYFRGEPFLTHRLAYAVFNGDFDDDLCILHKCDVKHCLNPDHLFLGTHADNVADKVAKGRQGKGEKMARVGRNNGAFGRTGEKNPMAKLRENQVLEILTQKEAGLSQCQIAKNYGMSQPAISNIIRKKTWKPVC
jgi:hypothetical protein